MVYHQEKSKLDALANLTERYDGYGGSVKRVMECKEEEKGIIGVVADIIKVDKQYETAIETALGGNIQNIVITFLKKHKAGRATFLPLTSITKPQEFKNPEALKEKGAIGMADRLVKVEGKYKNVAKAMLGRIMVVDHVDNAVKIARKLGYGIRMGTLEGELLVPGGAISGGAFKNSSNLLGRRREMEELGAKVKEHLAKVESLLEEIENVKRARNKLRMELENTKSSLQDKFIEQNTARMNVMKAEERRSEAEEGFGELKGEEKELEEKIVEIKSSKEAIQNIQEQINGFQKELEAQREKESVQSAEVAGKDLEVEKMLQRQGFHQQNVERIDGEIARYESELAEIEKGLADTAAEIERKEQNIRAIEETMTASETSRSDAEIQLKEDISRKEQLSAKQKNFFATREEMAERMFWTRKYTV